MSTQKNIGEIDVRKALTVFSAISDKGIATKNSEGTTVHTLNGLVAESSFDGYTIVIKNGNASLSIFFHNQFSFEYTNNKEKELFLEKMRVIEKL